MAETANTLKPTLQRVWRLPAVLNFTLGGLGSGMYLIGTFWSYLDNLSTVTSYFYKINAPLLVLLGLFMVALEAGRPSRAWYLIRNWKKSWMSRETLAAIIFVISCFLEVIFPVYLFSLIGVTSGFIFLLSQGMIIYKSRGLPAWNNWVTVALFIVSGFYAGSGLLLSYSIFTDNPYLHFSYATLGFLIFGMILWPVYLNYSEDSQFRLATKKLRKVKQRMLIQVLGHALPGIVIANYIILQPKNLTELTSYLAELAGVVTVFTAFGIRYSIIMKAGFYRQIALYRKKKLLKLPQ